MAAGIPQAAGTVLGGLFAPTNPALVAAQQPGLIAAQQYGIFGPANAQSQALQAQAVFGSAAPNGAFMLARQALSGSGGGGILPGWLWILGAALVIYFLFFRRG